MKKLRITVDGKIYDVEVEVIQDDDSQILPSYYHQSIPQFGGPVQQPKPNVPTPVAPKKTAGKVPSSDNNTLTSPINGVVLEIPVKIGQNVKENDTVLILEAMKMKTNISSPFSGTIDTIEVNQGDTIEAGDVLITFKKEA